MARPIKRKTWTRSEEALVVEMRRSGKSLKEIAKSQNRTADSVQNRLQKLGAAKRPPHPAEDLLRRFPPMEVVRLTGLSWDAVWGALRTMKRRAVRKSPAGSAGEGG